jgi:dTDP-4-amino-4,6-dideoxygalactose transaminase
MSESVPFVDLRRAHSELATDLAAAFERVVDSSGFVLGEEVERFEAEYADYCGVGHCVGVASGTAALTLAMLAAGVGHGDEVIVPAHTYIATALAVLHAGARPVFCEVEEETGLIDVDAAHAAVGARTAAVIGVHLYGQVCDMKSLSELARRHRLLLLEDAAQAHGATYRGRRAGALGAVAGFSFYPSKNLGCLGDGGAVTTDDAMIASRVQELRNLGQRSKGQHVGDGFNARLDALQAALLRVKLPWLDGWNAARRRHAVAYRRSLAGRARLLGERPESPCVYHLFPIRIPERDAVAARLGELGVQVAVHYSTPLHLQPPLARYAPRDALPVAESWAREQLSLPMFPELREAEVRRVTAAFGDAVNDDHRAPASSVA